MAFKSERKQRSLASKPQDVALATSILLSLAEADRKAICRFYTEGQRVEDIERDLGLSIGYVQQLKASVKARFFDERRRSASSDEVRRIEVTNVGALAVVDSKPCPM